MGRSKPGPARELFEDYRRRLVGPPWHGLELIEVEERRPLEGAERRAREGKLLLDALPKGATLIALDGRGKSLSSEAFAGLLSDKADAGTGTLAFAIGGASGFDPTVRARAGRLISLGAMTWPHMLVRVLLAEQLFRARAILTGHPYHRGEGAG
ncbi:MAG: 23S rRNA (pseudouridine(1915)-N(3))-methyltransferase RlmH [Rhodospirillales bacterium]